VQARSADLSFAQVEGGDVTGANLAAELFRIHSGGLIGQPAELPPRWSLVDGYLVGPTVNLTDARLAGADLAGAHLGDAYIFGAHLEGANLSGASLVGSHLGRADLQGADLSRVVARVVEFRFTDLVDATLTDAVIQGSNLSGARLKGAKLSGVLWQNDVCPDGSQSASVGHTCIHDLQTR